MYCDYLLVRENREIFYIKKIRIPDTSRTKDSFPNIVTYILSYIPLMMNKKNFNKVIYYCTAKLQKNFDKAKFSDNFLRCKKFFNTK